MNITERDIIMYQKVLNSISDGVLMVDMTGRIIVLNPSGKNILGIELSDLFGKRYAELFFNNKENDAFNEIFLEALENVDTRHYVKVPFIRKDAKKILLGVSMSLLKDTEDIPFGVIVIFRDITE